EKWKQARSPFPSDHNETNKKRFLLNPSRWRMALNTTRRLPSNASGIQIPRDGRALCQPQQSLKRLGLPSRLEKAQGKCLTQHRWCQTAILQTNPITEAMKKLGNPILCESPPLFR